MEIVLAIASEVAKYLVDPIVRQLGYLFQYKSNVAELQDEVKKLDDKRLSLQLRVKVAENKGDEILPNVRNWLTSADNISQEVQKFIEDEKAAKKSCLKGLCPDLISCYRLSRQATKKVLNVKTSQDGGGFQTISYRLPPPGVGSAPPQGYHASESRNMALRTIMEWLQNDDVQTIGVWGMGGVGKTMLVKQVAKQAKQENLFATEIYIEVSSTRDSEKFDDRIGKIQQTTAEMLGFQFQGRDESTRAVELKKRLQKEKILIILDDLWKEVVLEKVGIPSCQEDNDHHNKSCKIVLVSRDQDLLRKDMGVQKDLELKHLQEEEAWQLFKKTAGDSVNDDQLQPIARDVAKECQGLPIAIVTIAKALKDENVAVWKNALDEIRSSAPTNIRGMEEKVYSCVKQSYKHLKGDDLKSLFLLCGCLNSYGDMSMDDLLRYAMGLDVFDHIKSLEQARNKLLTLVGILKASSLLLEGADPRRRFGSGSSNLLFMDADIKGVRMHDVVRDVARNIASNDPHRFKVIEDVQYDQDWSQVDESKFISLNCKSVSDQLPQRLVCPELKFFILRDNASWRFKIPLRERMLNIPNTFFEGMSKLKVLDLFGMQFKTLPSTFQSLANLRTLILDSCNLEDIAVIGELKKLQCLSMADSNIRQLPKEMEQLTDLRMLDLNNCGDLKIIPRNILTGLSRLECLCMNSSFTNWAPEEVSAGESSNSNACLSELNHLHHLKMIEVKIPDIKMVPKEDNFLQNLTSFAVLIGLGWLHHYGRKSKTLALLCGDGSLLSSDGIGELLKKTQELELRGLEEVCRGPILRSLDSLQILQVTECSGLKTLFFLSMARSRSVLPQLQRMTIGSCNAMQQIIAYDHHARESEIIEDDHMHAQSSLKVVTFPKLQFLTLSSLRQLINFGSEFSSESETTSQGMRSPGSLDIIVPLFSDRISFPNLEGLKLLGLSMLETIWHPQVPLEFFKKLQILHVYNCPRLVNLIPSHMIQSFQNLKEVTVYQCEALEHVFDYDGINGDNRILPKVEILHLELLPKFKGYLLSPSKFKDFHHLKKLRIFTCGMPLDEKVFFSPNLEDLLLKSFSQLTEIDFGITPKLKFLLLEKLPKLSNIISYGGEDENAIRKGCPFSPSMFKNFHNLEAVSMVDCGMENGKEAYNLAREKLSVLDDEVCNYEAFESRASTFNGIMGALGEDNINLVSVVGTRGVGKTTLLKHVAQHAKLQNLFTQQVYVDLSRNRDSDKQVVISTIQTKIGNVLLDFYVWKFDGSQRTAQLKKRLKEEKGKILIILDDIWKEIDLDEIGIPSCKQCKILLTCRDGEVLCKENQDLAQAHFIVETLPPQEAWTLFKKTIGFDNSMVEKNEEVRSIAIQVTKECDGLPIAIVTIARALKDETVVAVWNNVLENLRSWTPTDMGAQAAAWGKKVYSCLERSYTQLKGVDVKSLLFLCASLIDNDIEIRTHHLLQYVVGLDLFRDHDRYSIFGQPRSKLISVSSWLLEDEIYSQREDDYSSFLFRDGNDKVVKMHDVFYDVAREIASNHHPSLPFVVKEDAGFKEWSETEESRRCVFISLHWKGVDDHQLPQELVCPELQFFLFRRNNPDPYLNIPIPNTFFREMKNLRVLDLCGMGFTTLPAVDSLANLRTLHLDWCNNLVDIVGIGKLTKLQVLSLMGSGIQQLPDEMAQLTDLRLLDLNRCERLKIIPRNILSSLSRLECFCNIFGFNKWAMAEAGDSNACLSELNHLSYLTTLYITIPNVNMLPKDIQLENLTRYAILVGYLWGLTTDRTLRLKDMDRSLYLWDGISKLAERSQELEIRDLSGTNHVLLYPSSNPKGFLELKHLQVNYSADVQYIIDSTSLKSDQQKLREHGAAFPLLESLKLWDMNRLEVVWRGPVPIGSFGNLKTLEVSRCPELRHLFLLSTAKDLSRLENMSIEDCKGMQQIIKEDHGYDGSGMTSTNLELFPNLRNLKLKKLPQLVNFSIHTTSSHHKVLFSKLEALELNELPKLIDVWSPQRPFGSFSNLRTLKVYKCPSLFKPLPSHLK